MKDFNFKIPQNIQFGMGSLKKLPEIGPRAGKDRCRQKSTGYH